MLCHAVPSSMCREPRRDTLGKAQGAAGWSTPGTLSQGQEMHGQASSDGCSPSGMGERQLSFKGLTPPLTSPSQQPGPATLPLSRASPVHRTTHSGLPESSLLSGDFSSARSCDCSLKGKAFLAEGDIKFSQYRQ